MNIRAATIDDVSTMVELSDTKRTQYAEYSPLFWRKAEGASEKQTPFFKAQVERENNIVLVYEESGKVEGFVIASLTTAPPVYDPGGQVCGVDDFVVSGPERWHTVGEALLAEVKSQAKARGAVLSVLVCGHLDEPKRDMLRKIGFSIASEWYVNPIE
ncbi:MAG TPA: GNAT family N-acetyltransferase [Abditibacteriaceae bacterium]|jgi:GNAT superfamily N-acetyltransferase